MIVMRFKLATALVATALLSLADTGEKSLAGSWKLVSYTDTSPSGTAYFPFGTNPRGEFVFSADGHFAAGIECDPNNGSLPADYPVPEFDDLTRPYVGFVGSYAFNPGTGAVKFDIAGSSAPSNFGQEERAYVDLATGLCSRVIHPSEKTHTIINGKTCSSVN
jgi:hypothetical protein